MMKKRLLRFLFPENAESFLEFKPTDTPSFILSSSRNKSLGLEAPSSCRFLCILVSRWNSSFKFHCQGILYFISVDLASPRSDHMKIHVKNIVCSYWNLGNLFSDCEQFQPIFGTPLWPDHSLQCNLWWHCNIWTFHHCPAPVLRGAWTLLSLPSCGSSHHLPCLWSRFTSVKFAFGHVDLKLEELLNLI